MSTSFPCLRSYLKALKACGELQIIDTEVDPHLELAEIHRRVVEKAGPALLFTNVKGSDFPLVTNLYGTEARCELALGARPEKKLSQLLELAQNPPTSLSALWKARSHLKPLTALGKKTRRHGPILEHINADASLYKIPFITPWPQDHEGGFLTLPLVYTEGEHSGNLGMYRIQRHDAKTTGLHFQIGKGGGFHYHMAEQNNQPLPVTIFLGGPPALTLSAIAPLPENISELLLCSFLLEHKLEVCHHPKSPHPLIAHCELALVGQAPPHERRLEGPFGDHYGYYSYAHPFPVFNLKTLFHRKDAIVPATIVGKGIQEDLHLGHYLQKLLSPLFPLVMPGILDLWSYGEAGFHSIAAARIQERYEKEALKHAFRILGEGQLSLSKFLLITDQAVDLKDFKTTLTRTLERFVPEKDLYIFCNTSYDTLDYSSKKLNHGSKAALFGLGEKRRELPKAFKGPLPNGIRKAQPYCPGCLQIQPEKALDEPAIEALLSKDIFKDWPLIVIVDEPLESCFEFLWTVFTRFEPAQDIYAQSQLHKHEVRYFGPVFIDAQSKAHHAETLSPTQQTVNQVDRRWNEYFSAQTQ